MPWWYHVVESKHELQNPTSPEKIRRLGQSMALTPSSRVLDVGAGRGGPAVILAQAFGCRITCVERAQEFIEVARARVEELRLRDLIEIVEADGRQYSAEPGTYDAAMCLGASFIWDGLGGTLRALTPVVKPNGFVAVGEPYWRTWPLPEGYERDEGENFVTLLQTIGRFEAAGLTVVGLIDASLDDWDRYQSLHWLAG